MPHIYMSGIVWSGESTSTKCGRLGESLGGGRKHIIISEFLRFQKEQDFWKDRKMRLCKEGFLFLNGSRV